MTQLQGIIYKIIPKIDNYDDGDVYYGSSLRNELKYRWCEHSSKYKRYCNDMSKEYWYSFKLFDKYGIDNCKIELVENLLCDSIDELKWKERQYIDNNICVNNNKPIKTNDEKKENTKNYNKDYYENNKEYYQQHNKQYRIDHKNEISEREKTKYHCDICDIDINQYYKSKHEQSEKHLNLLNNVIIPEKDKTIYCDICDHDISRQHIARHNKTKLHILNEQILNGEVEKPNNEINLNCEKCNITYSTVSSYNRHLKSKKHLDNV
jgi:hypothetical protein